MDYDLCACKSDRISISLTSRKYKDGLIGVYDKQTGEYILIIENKFRKSVACDITK